MHMHRKQLQMKILPGSQQTSVYWQRNESCSNSISQMGAKQTWPKNINKFVNIFSFFQHDDKYAAYSAADTSQPDYEVGEPRTCHPASSP